MLPRWNATKESGDNRQPTLARNDMIPCSSKWSKVLSIAAFHMNYQPKLCSKIPESEVQQLHRQLTSNATTRDLSPSELLNLRVLNADRNPLQPKQNRQKARVAIASLLFNWPSTGGGIVHTAELATFLSKAGYEVCHFYAVHDPWQIGRVEKQLAYKAKAIRFTGADWNMDSITRRFRSAIDCYSPDCVIVTDSWNSKPKLANALMHYPVFLRLAALECICPLNNVRLLPGPNGEFMQCHRTQLATPKHCQQCVETNQHRSGQLHCDERALSGFQSEVYAEELHSAFANAAAVLAVNPLIASLCEPFSRAVHVIPSGFDAARFEGLPEFPTRMPFRLAFAGLINEYMKGFHILFAACDLLWKQGRKFELHVTGEASECSFEAPFLKFRGWQSQESLPKFMAECHAIVVPTVAQEALGRTAVEAMSAARPVFASRIGGLSFTVVDGFTGLLFEPSNPSDLATKIQCLMDDVRFAQSLGSNGRDKFLNEHTWDVIIQRHYDSLFDGLIKRC